VILHLAREGLLSVKNSDFETVKKNKPSVELDTAARFRHKGDSYKLMVKKGQDR
jgi:hypothetical protein